jgi:hypothetical protein
MIRLVIGALIVLFGAGMIVMDSAPRLWAEWQHGSEFVPAANLKITGYKCRNLRIGLFDRCTVTYDTVGGVHAPRTLTDWRFGSAPTDQVVLLQRRGDAATVTTNLALDTLWNRLAITAFFALFGVLVLVVVTIKIVRGQPAARIGQA